MLSESETRTAMTISQISALEKPLSASLSAAADLPGLVTPVMATRAMATTESEPD